MEDKESQARSIVTRYMWWSMGAGLIPFPFWDLAAITAVQLKMLSDLAKNYDVPFSRDRGKAIISSLLGSVVPGVLGSTVKVLPVVGSMVGGIAVPIFAGASTYGIGKVFIQHFESGGTFLDLEPAKVRAFFKEQFEKGQGIASTMRHGEKEPATDRSTTRSGQTDPTSA
jgi:uncharacterized protein (DUF697 family)